VGVGVSVKTSLENAIRSRFVKAMESIAMTRASSKRCRDLSISTTLEHYHCPASPLVGSPEGIIVSATANDADQEQPYRKCNIVIPLPKKSD
jgi:hypothetical protein